MILHFRIPGTVPGGYPEYRDSLRGGLLTVVVIFGVHVASETLLVPALRLVARGELQKNKVPGETIQYSTRRAQ